MTIAPATAWGWGIGMVVCMLMMGVMMFAMMGHGRAGGGWTGWWPGRWPESREEKETPVDVLERRFAEGEISLEDYRERRDALTSEARARADVGAATRVAATRESQEEEP